MAPIEAICDVAEGPRRDDLSRRGARGRPLRPARRRRLRARGRRPPPHAHRGDARQGVRLHGRLTSPARRRCAIFVRSFASGFIFTTALPPAIGRRRPRRGAPPQAERDRASRAGAPASPRSAAGSTPPASPHLLNESHIVPVMIGDPVRCKAMSDLLLERYGVLRAADQLSHGAARHGKRLRITPSAAPHGGRHRPPDPLRSRRRSAAVEMKVAAGVGGRRRTRRTNRGDLRVHSSASPKTPLILRIGVVLARRAGPLADATP